MSNNENSKRKSVSGVKQKSKAKPRSPISRLLYMCGTLVLVGMLGICAYNFSKDARTFQLPQLFQSTTSEAESTATEGSQKTSEQIIIALKNPS
ncbi:MAG: hypothetical protein HGA22_09245, partial [Clostridiales bacterium]|nr:hypothetical protein [Clostridiales bacterium]